jgi:menaquinone-dependent protoporphyrinogen oxidase
MMAKILIVYGTTEGHTAQIAQRDVCDSKDLRKSTIKEGYDGVLVGGSVHAGEHQSSVREFVRRNRELVDGLPSAFFSVSLTAVEVDEEARRETQAMVDKFVRETGWQPRHVETIAGALVYSQYNIFVRHLMKLIAKHEGRPTDMSHDYDYTDWDAVEKFARDFAESVEAGLRRT